MLNKGFLKRLQGRNREALYFVAMDKSFVLVTKYLQKQLSQRL